MSLIVIETTQHGRVSKLVTGKVPNGRYVIEAPFLKVSPPTYYPDYTEARLEKNFHCRKFHCDDQLEDTYD